jgi:hypothetical protein
MNHVTLAKQTAEVMNGSPIHEARPRASAIAQIVGSMGRNASDGRADANQRT